MTPEQLVSVLVALTALLAAVAALVTSIRVVPAVQKTHDLVNSQSEKLNALTARESFLQGVAQGVASAQLDRT